MLLKKASGIILIAFTLPQITYSQWTNGQNADMVFGQSNYTTATPGSALNQLHTPFSITISPVNKKVFIADYGNGRILRYANYTSYTNGAAAELAITRVLGNSISPAGLYIDASDQLWIADYINNRVLRISNASTITGNDASPGLVLGQPDLISTTTGTALNQMSGPYSVFVDEARNTLWVSDLSNSRVLKFANAGALIDGASASIVLGTTGVLAATQNQFDYPSQIYVAGNGALWVADFFNNRVLRFSNAHTLPSGANADLVLGQASFTTNDVAGTSQTSMYAPFGIYGDKGGRIYISTANRILVFKNAAALSTNNAPADYVIGQPDFISAIAAVSQSGFNGLRHIFVDDYLWVADDGNNRVLRFSPATGLPVTLNGFTAKRIASNKITIQWQTTSEQNNARFDIEASADGINYTKVATVQTQAPQGNSSVPINYSITFEPGTSVLAGILLLSLLSLGAVGKKNSFIYATVVVILVTVATACFKENNLQNLNTTENIYVRIKQVDMDGQFKYSTVIKVTE